MAGYHYRTLNPTPFQFRLLTVSPGSDSADIIGSLDHHLLSASPKYEALSYVWGDAGETTQVIIDGTSCAITRNLEVALRRIRHEDVSRTLWIDAVCINQADHGERSLQAQRMADIYKNATRVLAWTGEASNDSDEALDLMVDFSAAIKDFLKTDSSSNSGPSPNDFRAKGFDPSSRNWKPLMDFWKRPYWSRVWIIQELASCITLNFDEWHGPTEDRCLIGCGTRWIECSDYMASALFFDMVLEWTKEEYKVIEGDTVHLVEPLKTFTASQPVDGVRMFATLRIASDGNEDGEDENSICALLRVASHFKATDVRDKLFALLGLSQEHNMIFPDYTKTARQVFMDLVQNSIQQYLKMATDSPLEILYGNRHGKGGVGPSWVPEPYGMDTLSALWDVHYCLSTAGGTGDVGFISVDHIKGLLNLKGVVVGVVNEVIGPLERATTTEGKLGQPDPSTAQVVRSLGRLASKLSPASWEIFWRTLLGDMDALDIDDITRPAPEALGSKAKVMFALDRVPNGYLPDHPDVVRYVQFIQGFEQQALLNLVERCFFTTHSGHMGIGPYRMKTGDVAVVLLGGRYCFVLRPVGPYFQLVGDAYIHDVMNREMLGAVEDGKASMHLFSLC